MRMKNRLYIVFVIILFSASNVFAASVEKLFLEGEYGKVVDEASRLIDSRAGKLDELYYLKGLSELKLNKFSDARNSFDKILSKYQHSKLTFDAYTGIGDSYFLEGNINEALRVYNEILVKFPNDKNLSVIQERIGNCRSKMGLPDKAKIEVQIPHDSVEGRISVQVGCFGSKGNAEKLNKKLANKGYESYLELPVSPHDNLYRVRVGKFQSREAAESLANRLKRDGYSTTICQD